jgi:hypothetical protein
VRRDREEVKLSMRKYLALTMVALLALTMALAAVGCGQKKEETTETTTPPAEQTMSSDTSMMAESTMTDTMRH